MISIALAILKNELWIQAECLPHCQVESWDPGTGRKVWLSCRTNVEPILATKHWIDSRRKDHISIPRHWFEVKLLQTAESLGIPMAELQLPSALVYLQKIAPGAAVQNQVHGQQWMNYKIHKTLVVFLDHAWILHGATLVWLYIRRLQLTVCLRRQSRIWRRLGAQIQQSLGRRTKSRFQQGVLCRILWRIGQCSNWLK